MRFKDMGMWVNDDGRYYSDSDRKYIAYDNPQYMQTDRKLTVENQRSALVSAFAIGEILNRTVIFPKFLCQKTRPGINGTRCTARSLVKFEILDKSLEGKFREHIFLEHPKVPMSIKNSKSKSILINTKHSYVTPQAEKLIKEIYTPRNFSAGATSDEIIQWFQNKTDTVLCFHSLYNAFWKFSDPKLDTNFHMKINPHMWIE